MSRRAFVSRFSPNRTDPKVLEAIFVQRHRLAEVWLEKLRDSILTGVKHHVLAIGPRGCGKSHLVSLLVHRLGIDPEISERGRIAWLPEDETTPSFWKFLLRILRALNVKYGNEFPPPPREQLEDESDDHRTAFLIKYLLEKLNKRTLLVVVENLDDVMRGLKVEGQKRWRAFLQEHPTVATLATSQQLTEDISDRDRPFFNFFQIEHLQPLSASEALELLQKLATQSGNTELATFLQTTTGRSRVRAIRHLAGGSHRVFIILSEFATRENLDDLVTAFEELLDDLTPYYQERLRWLPDQQREIVEFLCRQVRTVPVKEIAGELYLTEQTASAQLKSLKEKGYVTAETRGRESRYELAEPLMRLCTEVKEVQREPIRLIVEFLRIWYDRDEVETRLQCLPVDAEMERRHFQAVLGIYDSDRSDPILQALDRDLEVARSSDDPEELVRVLVDFGATADSVSRCYAIWRELKDLGRYVEALQVSERMLALDPKSAIVWGTQGYLLNQLGRYEEALVALNRALEFDSKNASFWNNRGWALRRLGQYTEALLACERAIELDPNYPSPWNVKGYTLYDLNEFEAALAACNRAIELHPEYASAWSGKGNILNRLGKYEEALIACNQAIKLDLRYPYAWKNRGRSKLGLRRMSEAIDDFRHAIQLNGGYAGAFEALVETLIQLSMWEEAVQVLANRFRLPISLDNPARSWHLPDIITTLFCTSTDPDIWVNRVRRLVDTAKQIREEWEQKKTQNSAQFHNPMAMLGDSLVRSLTKKAYAEASPDVLDDWAGVWQEVAEKHSELSLAARLFSVGVKYLRIKDERVLLDLLQEERAILRDLFKLDEGTKED